MTETCSWAACKQPATETDDQGWNHCAERWPLHVEETRPARPCGQCGEPYAFRTSNARYCPDCRAARPKKQDAKCGTRAGLSRHRDRKEMICDPCREAERAYQAARWERRRAA